VAYNLVRDFGTPSPAVALAVVAAGVALGLGVAYAWWRHRHHAERLIEAIKPIVVPLRPLIGMRGVALLAGSVVIWIAEATVYGMVAESVGISLGLKGALAVVAFTNLAMLIPGAPGNAGTYDGAVIYSTRKITGTSNALAYDLMLRLVIFVPISIVGMVLLFVRYGGLARLRAAREAASANAPEASPQGGAVALGADGKVGDPLPDAVEAKA
ncbi:MAG: lysylphosphatidylglycerol synthase domain-containing protein, partial [Actinomycetes bacterium]